MRTRYIIRRSEDGRYWGDAGWVAFSIDASRFEFMTQATYFALSLLRMGGYEFTVDPV